jgi:hypothetical protein
MVGKDRVDVFSALVVPEREKPLFCLKRTEKEMLSLSRERECKPFVLPEFNEFIDAKSSLLRLRFSTMPPAKDISVPFLRFEEGSHTCVEYI